MSADCQSCVGLRVEANRLSDLALEQLDRLAALRRLHEAIKESPIEDERAVAMALLDILEMPQGELKDLPGPFWEDLLPDVGFGGTE